MNRKDLVAKIAKHFHSCAEGAKEGEGVERLRGFGSGKVC
ncbi:hypothetical protein Q31b_34820 [Novipirellula aureliae]|uniref:Uncharacterized protein n=1 Tax=Novipirellula aureliae TaxID=2527966 RepID=A0A5C6DW34_9BACT|nr:hypothetical protein Q31b_34820 [Novipirellula aureliae]